MDFLTMSWVHETYPFTIDAFATSRNAIVGWYYSKAFEVEALGQDLFQQEVGANEFLWCNPVSKPGDQLTPGSCIANQNVCVPKTE